MTHDDAEHLTSDDWSFRIEFDDDDNRNCSLEWLVDWNVPPNIPLQFNQDGFVVFQRVLMPRLVDQLNDRLEQVLRGNYDRGRAPDKTPKLLRNSNHHQPDKPVAPLGFSGNLQNVKVLQIINVHKADCLFRKLACDPILGKVVAQVAGWSSARLAQDQVWAKPPGAPPLSFHRDSPYFMFAPSDVVTVWVALDDMDAELGPLEYVRGSHAWGEQRIGSSQQFFQTEGGRFLLESAAQAHGVAAEELDDLIVSMAGLPAGSISIHNGRTWHGSRKNQSSNRPRRGLGLHFVPGHVKFTPDASKSRLWRQYVENNTDNDMSVPDEDFPLTWTDSES